MIPLHGSLKSRKIKARFTGGRPDISVGQTILVQPKYNPT